MNKRGKIIIIAAVFIFVLSISGFMIGKHMKKPALTEDEVKDRVEKVYLGKVLTIKEKKDTFLVTFENTDGIYEVVMNKMNGKFSKLTFLQKKQSNELVKEKEGKQPSSNDDKPTKENKNRERSSVLLTEKEVEAIALKQFYGEIEHLEYIKSPDGGYYLVEVESDEEEVELQIHAVTGKILSVKYDD